MRPGIALLILLSLSILSCQDDNEQETRKAPRAAAETVSTPAPVILPDASPERSAFDGIKILRGSEVLITREASLSTQYANDARYMEMFGMPHESLGQQTLEIDGTEGSLTYVLFSSSADLESAHAHFTAEARTTRLSSSLVFENWLLVIQATGDADLDAFTESVRARIEGRLATGR